jgi:hypothetical protein
MARTLHRSSLLHVSGAKWPQCMPQTCAAAVTVQLDRLAAHSKALNLVAKAGMARPLCCTCAVMHTIQSTEATTHISFCIECKVIYSKTDTIQLAQVRPLPTAAAAKLADQAVSAGGSQPLTVTLTLLARQAHACCPNASETPKA